MKFIRLLALLVLSVPILLISCKKTTSIGANLLPANDGVNAIATDTFTVLTQEEAELPVPTNGMSNYLLGSMKDPIFGTSYAAIYTQVQLSTDDISFGDSVTVDSMVLSLPFYGAPSYYGIQNVPQTIDVYQMTQSLAPATTYYSNQSFSFNPTPIGVKKFIPNVASYTTSPTILGTVLPPQVRIKLSSVFVQELLSQSGSGTFTNNSTFQHFLNGLLIAPDTSAGFGGGIMYFDMTNANIYVYGKQGKVNITSELATYFPINSAVGVTTDLYKHNYTGTKIPGILSKDSASNSVLYLQSMGGLRAKVTIPHLKNLGTNTLINKAELELVQIHQSNVPAIDTAFSPPSSVEVVNDSLTYDYTMEDFNNAFLTYGGTAIPTTNPFGDSVDEYVVSIADQLQYELTGNPTGSTINYNQFNSFFLLTYPNPEIADRIVVGGGNSKSYKLVLHLIYTKINN
jgi:hypothetical protein